MAEEIIGAPAIDTTGVSPEVMARLAFLEAQNAELTEAVTKRAKGEQTITPSFGEKNGNLLIYGLQKRFPMSFYLSQWEALKANFEKIDAFVEANRARFSVKTADKPAAK
jgi:hypothetical protein